MAYVIHVVQALLQKYIGKAVEDLRRDVRRLSEELRRDVGKLSEDLKSSITTATAKIDRFDEVTPYYYPGSYKVYAPEWVAGGVYGMLYYKGYLFYTLAFDAKFIAQRGRRVVLEYNFEKVGPAPRSGGDTYGAITAVDNEVYFGGWVHAPVDYDKSTNKLYFTNKYAHLHKINIDTMEVELLFKDSIEKRDTWSGEISDLVYDPLNDRILLARGDGMENLGIYAYDRKNKSVVRITDKGGVKGTIFLDFAVFNTGGNKLSGWQCINLRTGDVIEYAYSTGTVNVSDGGPLPPSPFVGPAVSIQNRFYQFIEGGVIHGDPTGVYGWYPRVSFIRLFDTLSGNTYTPMRTNALPVNGGVLVAYNANDTLSPTPPIFPKPRGILIFTDGYIARIVWAGGRITSLATDSRHVYIGTTTNENGAVPTAIDMSDKSIVIVPIESLFNQPPPPIGMFTVFRGVSGERRFGGIPLLGYRRKIIYVYATTANTLRTEFFGDLFGIKVNERSVSISTGFNKIDISDESGIAVFRFDTSDGGLWMALYLE